MPSRSLKTLLVSDGKPGHYRQSEGLIAAIARLRPVETVRLDVRRRFAMPARTLQHLLNSRAPSSLVLHLGYRLDAASIPAADVVISAGGDTLAANAAIAKAQGIPNIFCGRLRRLAPEHVRLVITTLERLALAPNYLVSLPPSPIEPSPRDDRGNGAAPRHARDNPPSHVGVLIGGNSGSMRYDADDWLRLLRFLREAHRSHGVRWLVATSRRSGSFIADALTTMAQEPESGVETFIDYRAAGPGTLPQIFASADAILCTDDSTMMLSEAVGACLPVVSVVPLAADMEPREAEFRQALAAQGWYRRVLLSSLTPEAFLTALGEIEPRTTNQIDELAAAVRQRLPELFTKS